MLNLPKELPLQPPFALRGERLERAAAAGRLSLLLRRLAGR
jgi:hypothetical protein